MPQCQIYTAGFAVYITLGRMIPEPSPKRRLTWVALLVGTMALALLFLASVVAEPLLIAAAEVPVGVEPRSSAGGWANGNIWVIAVGTCCFALLAVGYVVKHLSPPGSRAPAVVLLLVVIGYVFFAQLPATRSILRISFWSIALPASFAFGAWLASRSHNAA
jgi:K+-transporting ATPase A subunit